MNARKQAALWALALLALPAMAAEELAVTMNRVDEKGVQEAVGSVAISESPYGLVFTPSLAGLPSGIHGFHVHENPSCAPKEKDGKMTAAQAAGGHYDPAGSKHHGLPWGDGHLGDLPALVVDAGGAAGTPVLAPRLKMDDVHGRALMVHMGGDNHSDHPAPLGGGGARMLCGVIP